MDNPYHTGFYFNLSFHGGVGEIDAAFQEASGLSKETKQEEIASGGENRFKYRVPGIPSFQNLVLKRGMISLWSPLINWCSETLDDGLAGPIKTKDIQLNLLNPEGIPCRSWSFINAYPVKWSTSDLKSQDSAILIETIEFAFNYFDITTRLTARGGV